MIDVNLLHQRVSQDILADGRSGYESNDEFNRAMQEAQLIILEKHHAAFEANQQNLDALQHLIFPADLLVSSGYADLPSDYMHKVSLDIKEVDVDGNVVCYDKMTKDVSKMHIYYSKSHQFSQDVYDPIQGVDVANIAYYTIEGGKIRIMPLSVNTVTLRYIKKPVDPVRVVSYDINDAEVYDSVTSVQLDWPVSEFPNFVSTMVTMRSVSNRDPEVANYNNLSQIKTV